MFTNKLYTCSKHNYTSLNTPCPDCNIEDGEKPSGRKTGYASEAVPGGGQFEDAYKYAIKVLDKYISDTKEKAKTCNPDGGNILRLQNKAFYMHTAKRTIEENIKMYLEHPEAITDSRPEA